MNETITLSEYIKRYMGLLFLFLSIVVVIGVVWKYIVPKVEEMKSLREEISALGKKRDDLATYVAYLNDLSASALAVEEELVHYALPSENDVISLIVTYEGLSKTEDVEVSPFSFTPGLIQKREEINSTAEEIPGEYNTSEEGNLAVKILPFVMNFKTQKEETAYEFIRKVHQTRRTFVIKTLSWKNPEKNASDKNIEVTMSLETYYYPEAPLARSSSDLVKKGQTQTSFIDNLNSTLVFEGLVLDSVDVGKQDFFTYDDSVKVPTIQKEEDEVSTKTATISAFQ